VVVITPRPAQYQEFPKWRYRACHHRDGLNLRAVCWATRLPVEVMHKAMPPAPPHLPAFVRKVLGCQTGKPRFRIFTLKQGRTTSNELVPHEKDFHLSDPQARKRFGDTIVGQMRQLVRAALKFQPTIAM